MTQIVFNLFFHLQSIRHTLTMRTVNTQAVAGEKLNTKPSRAAALCLRQMQTYSMPKSRASPGRLKIFQSRSLNIPYRHHRRRGGNKNHNLENTTGSDLQGLRIGIIRGELCAEKGTAGMNPSLVNSYDQLMKMLDCGHLDCGHLDCGHIDVGEEKQGSIMLVSALQKRLHGLFNCV